MDHSRAAQRASEPPSVEDTCDLSQQLGELMPNYFAPTKRLLRAIHMAFAIRFEQHCRTLRLI